MMPIIIWGLARLDVVSLAGIGKDAFMLHRFIVKLSVLHTGLERLRNEIEFYGVFYLSMYIDQGCYFSGSIKSLVWSIYF